MQKRLGSVPKMAEWFKTDKNRQNIIGLDPGKDKVWVSKDGGDVDGITAATISSRAFLDAIDRAYRAYMTSIDVNLDARTSASAQKIQKDTTVRSVVKTVVPKEPAAQKKKAEFGKKKTKTPVKEEPVKNTEEPKKEEVDGQSSASATY